MAAHYYPCIFFPDEPTGFGVVVPDIQGCLTQGEDLTKAMYWTVDAIGTMLDGISEEDFPKPSKIENIDISEYQNPIINIVEFDPDEWKKNLKNLPEAWQN